MVSLVNPLGLMPRFGVNRRIVKTESLKPKAKARVVRHRNGVTEVCLPLKDQEFLASNYMGLCPYSLKPMFDLGSPMDRRRKLQELTGRELRGRLEVILPGQSVVLRQRDRSQIVVKLSPKNFPLKELALRIQEIMQKTGRKFSPKTIRNFSKAIAHSPEAVTIEHILPQAWINENSTIPRHSANNFLPVSYTENQGRGDVPVLSRKPIIIGRSKIALRPIALSWFISIS